MLVGGGQGQIRYALMVDDQATAKLNTFKNSIVQLGNSTTNVQRNIRGFTASLSKQATAFSAGINPIKQQGAALTGLTNNLKSHATQLTGVGTKIKDTASKFAGFATGLSATASGVLQLGAGFRDYSDAQIAVERVTRKNSLAHEALTKAQDKLNALTTKGVKSGKDYEQAQLDVSQAQSQVSIQTQLLGEATERMFDSQTQFVASVIPTTLGALGTLGSAFKDLGGPKGMGGLVDKFKTLGTSVSGMDLPLKGLKGNLLGLGAIAGVGIASAITIFEEFNAIIKDNKDVTSGAITPMKAVGNEMERWTKIDFSTLEASLSTIVRNFGLMALTMRLIKPEFDKLVEAQKKEVTVSGQVEAARKRVTDAIVAYRNALKSRGTADDEAARQEMILAKNNLFQWETLGKVSKGTDIATVAIKKYNTSQDEAIQLVQKSAPVFSQLGAAFNMDWVAISKLQGITDSFGASLPTLVSRFKELNAARKEIPNWLTPDMQLWNKWASDPNPSAVLHSNAISILDVKAAMQDWDGVIKKNTVSAADNAKAIAEQTKRIQEFKTRIAEGVKAFSVTLGIKDNATKLAKDILDNIDKKLRKPIKTTLQLRADVKAELTNFNSAIATAATLSEKQADGIVKGIIKTIDEKFKGTKGPFAGLRAQLETTMKDPNTVAKLNETLMNGDYTAAGKKIVGDIGSAVKLGWPSVLDEGLKIWTGKQSTAIIIPAPVVPAPITTAFDTGIQTVKDKVTGSGGLVSTINSAKITVPALNISTATKSIDRLIGNFGGYFSTVQKANPIAKINIGPATKLITRLIDNFNGYVKAVNKANPVVKINIGPAVKSIDRLIGDLKGIPNINRTVTIHTQNVTDFAKGGIMNFAKGGLLKAQEGLITTHGKSLIQFGDNPGGTETAAFIPHDNPGPTLRSLGKMFGGGERVGGDGDIIVNLNISGNEIVDERKITRRVKGALGTNRFTMGA